MHHTRLFSSRRRRGLWAAAAAVALAVSLAGPSSAASPPQSPLAATVSNSAIDLTWSAVHGAEAYLVVDERSGEVLWRGSETSYTAAVQAPTSRSLLLFADTGNTSALLGKVLAMAPGHDSALPPAASVTTASGTDLNWGAADGVTQWNIDAPGLTVPSVAGNRVALPYALGSDETVRVIGDTVIEGEPTRLVSGFALAPAGYSGSDLGGDAQPGDVVAAGVYPITTSRVPYETFIPDQYINAPDNMFLPMDCESGDGSDYWYAGDNRGLAYESGKYRTRGLATYYWSTPSTFTTKVVSPTKRYKKTSSGFVYDSQRTASSDGFVMNPVTNNGRDALTQINHSVGNPYCSAANNIDYDIRQEMHQNGGHYFLGRHDRMPDHQLYRSDQRSDGSVSVSLVFHHKLQDPTCLNFLNPACPQHQYQYSR